MLESVVSQKYQFKRLLTTFSPRSYAVQMPSTKEDYYMKDEEKDK